MKKRLYLLALIATILANVSPALADDGFYVIAGGGKGGKVLNVMVYTDTQESGIVGTETWSKLPSPQWTYKKLSATSYLAITYQDSIGCQGVPNSGQPCFVEYQIRVNDNPSIAGSEAATILTQEAVISGSATGIWSELPKGDVNLSIWHRQWDTAWCGRGKRTTSVIVLEIEPIVK
jgi:hypothetical protein